MPIAPGLRRNWTGSPQIAGKLVQTQYGFRQRLTAHHPMKDPVSLRARSCLTFQSFRERCGPRIPGQRNSCLVPRCSSGPSLLSQAKPEADWSLLHRSIIRHSPMTHIPSPASALAWSRPMAIGRSIYSSTISPTKGRRSNRAIPPVNMHGGEAASTSTLTMSGLSDLENMAFASRLDGVTSRKSLRRKNRKPRFCGVFCCNATIITPRSPPTSHRSGG